MPETDLPNLPGDVEGAIQTLARYADVNPNERKKTPKGRGEHLGIVFRGKARVKTVEDGDTLKGVVSPFPGMELADGVFGWWRLPRVDTHETDGKNAKKAKKEKQFTTAWVQNGRDNYSGEDGYPFAVEFEAVERGGDAEGTYGRLLVDVVRRHDGAELNDALLSNFDGIQYKPSQ